MTVCPAERDEDAPAHRGLDGRAPDGGDAGAGGPGQAGREATGPAGPGPLVTEYLWDEVLGRQKPDTRAFLTRTSVVADVCGDLADAICGQTGGAATLARLNQENCLVDALDGAAHEYRYHPLLREVLSAELHRQSPDEVAGAARPGGPVVRRARPGAGGVRAAIAAWDWDLATDVLAGVRDRDRHGGRPRAAGIGARAVPRRPRRGGGRRRRLGQRPAMERGRRGRGGLPGQCGALGAARGLHHPPGDRARPRRAAHHGRGRTAARRPRADPAGPGWPARPSRTAGHPGRAPGGRPALVRAGLRQPAPLGHRGGGPRAAARGPPAQHRRPGPAAGQGTGLARPRAGLRRGADGGPACRRRDPHARHPGHPRGGLPGRARRRAGEPRPGTTCPRPSGSWTRRTATGPATAR